MQRRVYVTIIVALLLTSGCARKDFIAQKYAESMAADVLFDKTKVNGADALCGQSGYLDCLKEPDWKCKMEVEPLREPCYKRSVAKMNKPLVMENYEEFVSYYMTCIMTSHFLKQGLLAMQGAECVSKVELDENKLITDLFK